jgi:hypothetical protein
MFIKALQLWQALFQCTKRKPVGIWRFSLPLAIWPVGHLGYALFITCYSVQRAR